MRDALNLLLRYIALPVSLGMLLFALVLRYGKHLVNKPQLAPHAAVTVSKEAAKLAKKQQ